MSIKKREKNIKFSKQNVERREFCRAKEDTIVFSFQHITRCEDYNFKCFDKQKKNSQTANAIEEFIDKLSLLSKMTWDEFWKKCKKSGMEQMPCDRMEQRFINGIDIPLSADEKLISVRFNSQNSRIIMRRGTKCPRVAHILGIDYDLKLYKH